MAHNVFKIVLVRHGETHFNQQRLLQGQLDIPLNETGKLQAVNVGNDLSEINFSHIYSSNLKRAKETCKLLLSANTYFQCKEKVNSEIIKYDSRLRERAFGCMEGKLVSDLITAASKAQKKVEQYVAEGGESWQEVRSRAKDFFVDLCSKLNTEISSTNHDNNVLIVSHGGLIRALFLLWSKEFFYEGHDVSRDIIVGNTSRSCVKVTLPSRKDSNIVTNLDSINNELQSITIKCEYFNVSSNVSI